MLANVTRTNKTRVGEVPWLWLQRSSLCLINNLYWLVRMKADFKGHRSKWEIVTVKAEWVARRGRYRIEGEVRLPMFISGGKYNSWKCERNEALPPRMVWCDVCSLDVWVCAHVCMCFQPYVRSYRKVLALHSTLYPQIIFIYYYILDIFKYQFIDMFSLFCCLFETSVAL